MPSDNCHDKLFKASLADPKDAAMALRAVLAPSLVCQIDFSSLRPVPGSFVDEAMRGSQTDLLYTVSCADKPALLYVLMEHKSEVDRWTLLQLLRYMARIWEHCLVQKQPPAALPPIIPVIVHHSDTGWTAPTHFQGLFDSTLMSDSDLRRLTPEFEVQLDDISFATDEELRGRAMGPAATLGFLFLRDGRRGQQILEELMAWADLLRPLAATESGRRALFRLFSYLPMVAPNINPSEFVQQVQRAIPERNDIVTTLAEQWMEQGEKRGLERGIVQGVALGRLEGERSLVRRQIELKFGPADSRTLSLLSSADDATLERYAERVLTATSIDEVLGE